MERLRALTSRRDPPDPDILSTDIDPNSITTIPQSEAHKRQRQAEPSGSGREITIHSARRRRGTTPSSQLTAAAQTSLLIEYFEGSLPSSARRWARPPTPTPTSSDRRARTPTSSDRRPRPPVRVRLAPHHAPKASITRPVRERSQDSAKRNVWFETAVTPERDCVTPVSLLTLPGNVWSEAGVSPHFDFNHNPRVWYSLKSLQTTGSPSLNQLVNTTVLSYSLLSHGPSPASGLPDNAVNSTSSSTGTRSRYPLPFKFTDIRPTSASSTTGTDADDEFFLRLKRRTLDPSRSSCDSRNVQQLLMDLNALMHTNRSLSD